MMNEQAIFLPMLGVMMLTAVVWTYMFALRIPAMKKARKPVQTYTSPDKLSEYLPEAVQYPANNLKNLFELPVVFYALCLYLHASANVDAIYLATAWAFFVFRVLHSIVHCTVNRVTLRFYLYATAACALWFMLLRAVIDLAT